jgi:GntR family transcriptional regulator
MSKAGSNAVAVKVLAAPADETAEPLAVTAMLELREDSARPMYQQLEDQLIGLIQEGRIPLGATMPAERHLAEVLGVSRATIQRCYNALRERRLIRGHGRHGSIVEGDGARLLPGMDRLKGFTQEMHELGRRPATRVLEQEVVCDRVIASLFGLPSTARFLRLVRIRFGDDVPLSHENAWYSLDAAPFLETADMTVSIYAQLAGANLALSFCDQTIEAAMPSAVECDIFGFAEPVPCLLIKRRSYVRPELMLEYVEGVFRGDAYTYRIRLNA